MKHNSFAKCIIAGEHSVLRGGYALAVPLKNCQMQMEFEPGAEFKTQFDGPRGEELRIPFLVAMEKALDLAGRSKKDLNGTLRVTNNIPIGSGLGASAAFCVCVVKVFVYLGWVREEDSFHFAREIENLFHGESSGLDIAVILNAKPILYHRQEGMRDVSLIWKPNLYLSYSGNRGLTSDCVNKVKKSLAEHPQMGAKIDDKMKQSVSLILKALTQEKDDLLLKEGIDLGLSCFQDWNLVNANLREHMQILRNAGAMAVKPTGSGDGGFVLSLWHEGKKPDGAEFIPVF
jgi:mevalonate kinase